MVDGIGVSLASIQALQQQVQDKEARIRHLETVVEAMGRAAGARDAALLQVVDSAVATALAARP